MRCLARIGWLGCWLALVNASAIGSAEEPQSSAPATSVLASVHFDPDADGILLPVTIGGEDHLFILDTGATQTIVDTSLRQALGKLRRIERGYTPEGVMEVAVHDPPDARLGSLNFPRDGEVGCLDLTVIRESTGEDVCGIIGVTTLKPWIVRLDFDEGRVEFLANSATRDPSWGERRLYQYGEGAAMWVLATLGDSHSSTFQLDTGCSGTGDIQAWLFDSLVRENLIESTTQCGSATLGGIALQNVGRVTSLTLGPFRHERLMMASGKRNVLGLDYLKRFRVTIDFPRTCIYLAKGKRFDEPDRGSVCGLGLLFKPGRTEIVFAAEKGPAYLAGVRVGDVIREIDGHPASQMRPSAIEKALSSEGTTVQLKLEREGNVVEVSFAPKEYE